MSSLSGMTILPHTSGKAAPPPLHPAGGPNPAVQAVRSAPASPAAASREDAAAAARDKIAAAVRSAFLQGLVQGAAKLGGLAGAETASVPKVGQAPHQEVLLEEIMARISVQAVRLPVLPEPATPARDAFTEAVLAMRTGLRKTGGGALADGA